MPSWAEQLLPQLLIEQFDSFPIQCRHIEHMQGGVRFREIEHANTVLLGKIYWSLSVNKPGISCESKTTHDFLFCMSAIFEGSILFQKLLQVVTYTTVN